MNILVPSLRHTKGLGVLFLILMLSAGAQAQKPKQLNLQKKQLQAHRIDTSPKIDGILDEPIWQEAQVATNFIQSRPNPGPLEKHPTEVRIMYDDDAIYVGAIMHDVSRDSILMQLSERDNFGNTDFFGVFLDTYNDQINGFGFFITPAGVQLDARYSSNGEDFSWNAVWESNASVQGNDWVAEFKIPYSAIRFSNQPEQLWGVNFMRSRRSTRQDFFWSHLDPAKDGFVNQWGQLSGLQNIKAPVRLSFSPYVSMQAGRYAIQETAEQEASFKNDVTFSGGMDVKYGISDAFTLDMTLVPDFSQVQSDDQILNLSPFEVQYQERRPFFLEGTELFEKGNFFYSRRIGERPMYYYNVYSGLGDDERVIENPGVAKMLNGTKISGRTKYGLGIGVFNAVVGRSHAVIENTTTGERYEKETQPLTNYNILVLDQSLKNNSYVTLVNTNTMRSGSSYDANLTGLLFRFANKSNKYGINGKAALSQRYFSDDTRLGHAYNIGFGKISGNFTFNATHSVKSDTYNPNDLGYNNINNTIDEELFFSYRFFQPFWKFLNANTSLGAVYSQRFDSGDFQNFVIFGSANGTLKNFLGVGVNVNLEPVVTYDYFEPRVNGWYYTYPTNSTISTWLSSDYRKKFALDVRMGYRHFDENNRYNFDYEISPRYRVNDKLSFVYSFSKGLQHDNIGYASNLKGMQNKRTLETIENDHVIFGLRDVDNITNTLEAAYTFNNKMSLSLWARHYWSDAKYKKYYLLNSQNGNLYDNPYDPADYDMLHDENFNSFNIDMVYSWWFAPGSEISIVWKDIFFEQSDKIIPNYFDNVRHMISSPKTNTLSVKVLYYIDYLSIQRRFRKG